MHRIGVSLNPYVTHNLESGLLKQDFPQFYRHRYSLIKLNGGSPGHQYSDILTLYAHT